MFFKISHSRLILMVGILASAFVTSDSSLVFLLKFFILLSYLFAMRSTFDPNTKYLSFSGDRL